VVFDKTGTLTEEEPELQQIHCFSHQSKQEILRFAAAAEYRQSHPLAQAIINAAHQQGLILPEVEESACKLGYGIEAKIEKYKVCIGSVRFMELSNVPLSKVLKQHQAKAEALGHSMVLLAINGYLAGAIELCPRIRPEAQNVIQGLKAQNIHTCIISGDREIPTRSITESLGIDQYFSNTLPEQKASIIKTLQKQGKTVCFIGDGINDAIALKQADVSVSLNGATTAAIDTAQIILMDANLSHLLTLLKLGNKFEQNQKRNMAISVIPAIISIGGIFVLNAGLYLAALMFYGGLAVGMKNALEPIHLPNPSK
jgi:Cu2+-exporting ATPase